MYINEDYGWSLFNHFNLLSNYVHLNEDDAYSVKCISMKIMGNQSQDI